MRVCTKVAVAPIAFTNSQVVPPVDEVVRPQDVDGRDVAHVIGESTCQLFVPVRQAGVALQQAHGSATGKLVLQDLDLSHTPYLTLLLTISIIFFSVPVCRQA